MKKKILIVLVLGLSLARMVKADAAPISRQITLYFQQNGQPITRPITFSIKCYGTIFSRISEDKSVESKDILKISELSENCPIYGCKFDISNIFEVYRKNIKYCNLEGDIGGQKFTMGKFLGDKLTELSCREADFTTSKGGKYYKETPQYKECMKDVYREYYPQGNGEVRGDFLCSQYTTADKMIPTDISTEPNGPCYRIGYAIKNNICYGIPPAFFDCTEGSRTKTEICNKYLEDTTTKLAKNEDGYPFYKICEAEVDVPASISIVDDQQTSDISLTASDKQPHENIFNRIINFFKCTFLKIFAKTC